MSRNFYIRLAICLWASGLWAGVASAQAQSPLSGTWEGTFRCGGKDGSLRLAIAGQGGVLLEGELEFEVDAGRLTGSHRIRGRYDDKSRSLTIIPAEWLERPSGWRAMGLTGSLSSNGLTISGAVGGCEGISNDDIFTARRNDGKGGSVAVAAPADALVMPTGGPFEGHWRGHVSCTSGKIVANLDLLQDGENLVGLSTMTAPDGSVESRLLVSGEVAPGGEARLDGKENLNTFRNHRFLTFGELTGLRADGEDLAGKVGRLNIPARWKNCDRIAMTRAGAPRTPSSADAADLVGTWVGFDSYAKRSEEVDADFVHEVGTYGVPQVRLDFAQSQGLLFGALSVIGNSRSAPADQPRSVMAVRPLLTLDDGRIGFVANRTVRSDHGAPQNIVASGILVPSLGEGSTLLLERVRPKDRSDSFIRLVRPRSEAALAALNDGEGPPLPLPGSFGGKFGAAETLDAQCRAFGDWLAHAAGAGEMGKLSVEEGTVRLMPLLRDDLFEPAFGLPYSLLSLPERKALNAFGTGICPSRMGYDAGGQHAIDTIFGDDREFNAISGRLADLLDSRDWHKEALVEIGLLPDATASLAALDSIARDAEIRAAEIPAVDRTALQQAVTAKRIEIAFVDMTAVVESILAMPDDRNAFDEILDVARRINGSDIPHERSAGLWVPLRSKAGVIVDHQADAALALARAAPHSIDGLASITSAYHDIAGLIEVLPPELRGPAGTVEMQSIDSIREALIGDPAVVSAFAKKLTTISSDRGDPDATVEAFAARYLDHRHYIGSSAIPAYAQAVRMAIDDLAIRSISFADHSIETTPDEPTAREMMLSVKGFFDRASAELKSTFSRCQNRQYGNDPMAAMECLAILGAGGGQAFSMRMTRFEKIGCAPVAVRAGYVCDYVLGFASSSKMMQGRMAEIMGTGSRGQARFVRTTNGVQFIPMR